MDGPLAVADDAMTSWRASIHDLYTGWINDLDGEFLDLRPEVEALIESRLDSLDRSFAAVLGHIDYNPWNLLIRPESRETTAVLDWGHATAMAPSYALIPTEEHLSRWAPRNADCKERVRSQLAAGYTEPHHLEHDSQFTDGGNST